MPKKNKKRPPNQNRSPQKTLNTFKLGNAKIELVSNYLYDQRRTSPIHYVVLVYKKLPNGKYFHEKTYSPKNKLDGYTAFNYLKEEIHSFEKIKFEALQRANKVPLNPTVKTNDNKLPKSF